MVTHTSSDRYRNDTFMVSRGGFDFKYYHCRLSVPSFIFVGLQVFILLILLFDVMIFYFLKILVSLPCRRFGSFS